MLLAGLSFAVMSLLAKEVVSLGYGSIELVFYRSLIGWLLLGLWLRSAGQSFFGVAHRVMLLRRALVGLAALLSFFYAIVHLPVSVALTLNYTSPLFLAVLLPWTLREGMSSRQYAAVGLGFVGVCLLLQPWSTPPADLFAALVGLASGLLAAVAYLHVRRLGALGVSEAHVVVWFAAIGTLVTGLFAFSGDWQWPALEHAPWLVGMGLLATLGQFAVTRAYRYGHAAVTAAFAYSTVLFGSVLDVLIWGHWMSPWAWFGLTVTVLAGIWLTQQTRHHKGECHDCHRES